MSTPPPMTWEDIVTETSAFRDAGLVGPLLLPPPAELLDFARKMFPDLRPSQMDMPLQQTHSEISAILNNYAWAVSQNAAKFIDAVRYVVKVHAKTGKLPANWNEDESPWVSKDSPTEGPTWPHDVKYVSK